MRIVCRVALTRKLLRHFAGVLGGELNPTTNNQQGNHNTQCTGRPGPPYGSVGPRPGRRPGPKDEEAEVRHSGVRTPRAPSSPAATHLTHIRPTRLKACPPARLSPLAGRSGVRLQRCPMHPACTQPAALSPLAGGDEVGRQRGRHGLASGAPGSARPCQWCTCEAREGSAQKAEAPATLGQAPGRRRNLLGIQARRVALSRRAGPGSSGRPHGPPRARAPLAMADGIRGHFGRAAALSREMHGHGELVRVELAVAVDVREVPHLAQRVHWQA
eukprot:scaffold75020_cov52-Phaeocystis_antarctica.AAC.1